jgi:hypothetical protein
MSSNEKEIPEGQFEIVISKQFGTNESLQVRTTVSNDKDFHSLRKKLFKDFIKPREDEYQAEVRDYQMQMAAAAKQAEEEGK